MDVEKLYLCKYCEKTFTTTALLEDHVNAEHPIIVKNRLAKVETVEVTELL